jgi:hypothetical protein
MSKDARRISHLRITAFLLLAFSINLAGCIRSRVVITSEPSEAEVIWRGKPYGATPIEIPFIWYWHYDFVLEKPGFHSLSVEERFRAPPWFLMPVDLFMEIIPVPFNDTRNRHYVLGREDTSGGTMLP